jgi:hypothetical protein
MRSHVQTAAAPTSAVAPAHPTAMIFLRPDSTAWLLGGPNHGVADSVYVVFHFFLVVKDLVEDVLVWARTDRRGLSIRKSELAIRLRGHKQISVEATPDAHQRR